MGMDLLVIVTELPDESVTTKDACDKIADVINSMDDATRAYLRESVAYEADDDELIDIVQRYFIDYRSGRYTRNVDWFETFDSKGTPRTMTIFGCESWGDVPEAYDAGHAFSQLPVRWWE